MRKICDEDCFNCQYDDCIMCDDPKKLAKQAEKNATKDSYYWRNRERILDKYAKNKAENPEKLKEYYKKRYQKLKATEGYMEHCRERHHRYYQEHREEILHRQKERRRQKRLTIQERGNEDGFSDRKNGGYPEDSN